MSTLTVTDTTGTAPTVKGSTLVAGDIVGTSAGKYLVVNIGSLVLIQLDGATVFNSLSLDTLADFTPYSGVLTIGR